jgi:hypothetical protein
VGEVHGHARGAVRGDPADRPGDRYRVEDGVIREHHTVRDDLTLFRRLGLVP